MPRESTPSFSFTEADEVDGALRLRLCGELDLTVVEPLRRRLDQLHLQGRAVVLDLAELDFVDSAGIMLFVTAAAAARESGPELVLTPPHGEVERVLRLTGLREMLRFEERRSAGDPEC
jgi:anti-sigma B factor antagonist